ncbi:MAG: NAD-dependent epimerase/dehydratase family protein [Bryobacteraceae bacterium]|nr:NAD-dependent epimerase/dehydratase family protein [Bryobacterales bacterium]MEB2360343.1 NAD-dependent epimerase/dehydratase family protein [Bryobacterales bacterium]NUN01173.1 NAD-dependent epimerase/dehydratase family protein [Bryobacteraceae bacterium]
MKPALVTGASGFVGWHVAKRLLDRGYSVRALVRPGSMVRDLGVETVTGDLREPESLNRAASGCGVIFHVAADYRLWARRPQELYLSNVNGTANLLEAARKQGVECVVYTSTVGCIGVPEGGIGDEREPVTLEEMTGTYKRSKFLAEKRAREFAESGFPVVIVNPTTPVGDHDFKPTPTGRIVLDFIRGAMPAYVDTGLNFVDVRDTAEGHLLALERGRAGERYILGAENLSLQELFARLERLSGVRAPSVRIPYFIAYAAGMASTGLARITGREPRAPLDGVRMSRKKMFVSHEKAGRELGYAPAPVDGALARAIEWFRSNGYC